VSLHVVVPGAAIAGYVWRSTPEQRTAAHPGSAATRLFVGCMWWQQSLWKLPPYYTDQPDEPFGTTRLAYWMGLMGKHAAIPLQADFVIKIFSHTCISSLRSSTALRC